MHNVVLGMPTGTRPEKVLAAAKAFARENCTRDVQQITGRHRCTINRWVCWVCAGTFPPKRAGGGRGWLRSDIERWRNGAG